VPVAVVLTSVMIVGAAVWAVTRVARVTVTVPAGVVSVPAGQGTFRSGAKPAPVQVITGLAYGPDAVQRVDLYRPPSTRGALPLLVYLHSGGWVSGGRGDVPDFLLQEVTRLHIEVASVGYRLSGPHDVNPFPGAPSDVDRAVRWLGANAAFLAVDPARIVLAGTSAGGHLAALDAVAPGGFTAAGLPPELARATPRVVGVLDAVGPSDLAGLGREGGFAAAMVTQFLGCTAETVTSCDAATLRAASIAPHLTAAAPPAFLVFGKHDTLVPPATQGAPLAEAWAAVRGDGGRAAADRGVWYEVANDGHNVSQATINMTALERWLTAVFTGRLR
jgi:acetyl esterase/lipase